MSDKKIIVVSMPTREPSAMIQAALRGDKGYKIGVLPTREEAIKPTKERIAPDKFCPDSLGVPYEPLTCPCCGSDKTAGPELLGVLCWDCRARFRIEGGAVYMIECACSRHDDGRVIKSARR